MVKRIELSFEQPNLEDVSLVQALNCLIGWTASAMLALA